MTTTTNGHVVRKTLATQLDRLDSILDTLSEGLNEAVATAVEEAVGKVVLVAVQAAITEVLTNAELQERLKASFVNQVPAKPSKLKGLWAGLKSALKSGWLKTVTGAGVLLSQVVGKVQSYRSEIGTQMQKTSQQTKTVLRGAWMRLLLALTLAKRLRKPLLAALGVGVTVGLGCYFAGPLVASMVSGVSGFAGSLIASTCNALRRMLGDELQGT